VHGNGDGLAQPKVAAAGDEGHFPIELGDEPVPTAIAFGRIGPQRSEEGQQGRQDAVAGARHKRAIFAAQHDQTDVAGQQFAGRV
jgi:hypothetical protein